jgi:UPF0755 protein
MSTKKPATGGTAKKFIIVLVIILVVALGVTGFNYYLKYYGPSVTGNREYLYIHTGATFNDVYDTIKADGMVKDTESFAWAAQQMNYANRVKAGRYRLREGMSNRKLINMLASGSQDPVTLSFHDLRLKEQFAGFVSKKIEPDSLQILGILDSAAFLAPYGFTPDNVYTMFLPNTYQLYWSSTPEKFFKKMNAAYEKFWNGDRRAQAVAEHLSPIEVTILASIVDAEALHDAEMPIIAGLYINRLNKGMKLESDPTIIFAEKDFTIHRVLSRYLTINSPYNTYMHTGLPPGPIMMPSRAAVDAVLNYQRNNYIYMCAKEDFSGNHNFATNHADHLINAHKYQQALNERNIKR